MVRTRRHARVAAIAALSALPSLPAVLRAQDPYPCPYWVHVGEYYDIQDSNGRGGHIFFVRGITRSMIEGVPYIANYIPDGSPLISISGTHRWNYASIHAHCYTVPDPTVPGGRILVVHSDGYAGWADPIGEIGECDEYDEFCDDGGGGGGGGGGGEGGGDPGDPPGGSGGGGTWSRTYNCQLEYRDDQGNERWTCTPA